MYSKILFSILSGSIALLPSSGNSPLHLWDAPISCWKPSNFSLGIYVIYPSHLIRDSSLTMWDLLPAVSQKGPCAHILYNFFLLFSMAFMSQALTEPMCFIGIMAQSGVPSLKLCKEEVCLNLNGLDKLLCVYE